MPHLCLKCGRMQNAGPDGTCPVCGQIIHHALHRQTGTKAESGTAGQEVFSAHISTAVVVLYWGACISYLLGIFLPLMTIKKEVVLGGITFLKEANTVSMLSGIWSLLKEGQWFLFLLLFLFSVAFPLLKLFLLYGICCDCDPDGAEPKHLKWLSVTGKWAMLDVVVVGLLVVVLKLGDLVEVRVHAGIYFFAVSVTMTMVITMLAHATSCPRFLRR